MAKPLNQRIASARSTDRVTLTDLRNLIAEVREERDRLLASQAQAEADSVDILLSEADQDEAAAVAARSGRLAAGYEAALVELEVKLAVKLEADSQRVLDAERAAALAERDEIAERWREVYPRAAQELVELFEVTVANDARMAAARIYEPSAEAVARGLSGTFSSGSSYFDRLTKMKIMPLIGNQRIWPVEFDPSASFRAIGRSLAPRETV